MKEEGITDLAVTNRGEQQEHTGQMQWRVQTPVGRATLLLLIWNGEKLRVAFMMDCVTDQLLAADRKSIAGGCN